MPRATAASSMSRAAESSSASMESIAKGVKGLSGYMHDHAKELKAAGIEILPQNLHEALLALEKDTVLCKALGPVANDDVKTLTDINAREVLMLTILAVAVLWMGVAPKPFTDTMHVSVTELLKHVAQSKLQ